jgi:dTDP-4-dehydrorhamnose reductase
VRRLLLTGSDGQLGWELQRSLASLGEVVALNSRALDLRDTHALRSAVRDLKPEVVVNAAAFTAVDDAELHPDTAMAVNKVAPGILAEEVGRYGGLLVHYSTDYVFDGRKSGAYIESDHPDPLNVYGRSKLAGEQAICAAEARHFILRTSWIYSARGRNFLTTILRLASERAELRVVNDQIGAPTWSRFVAEATGQMLVQVFSGRCADLVLPAHAANVLHLSCAGSISWFEFAEAIVQRMPACAGSPRPRIVAISSADHGARAARPGNSLLSNQKLMTASGLGQPSWQSCLRLCMDAAP